MYVLSEDIVGVRANRSFMRGFTGGVLDVNLDPDRYRSFGVLAVREELSFLGWGWKGAWKGPMRDEKRSLQCRCGTVGVVVKTGQLAP